MKKTISDSGLLPVFHNSRGYMILKKILNKKNFRLILLALFIAGSNNAKCFNLSQDQIQQALGITTATALATTCSTKNEYG